MGKRSTRNMMDRRYLMLTLVAAFCTAVPTTDLVIPEKIDFAAYSTSASFIQAMANSGGTEVDCRTFAETTIETIRTDVTSEQKTLNAEDKGAECAQEGQTIVSSTQATLFTAKANVVTKKSTAMVALDAKATACTANVAFEVGLDKLESSKEQCYDYTSQTSYISAKGTCTSVTSTFATADQDVVTAQTAATGLQQDYDNDVAAAAKLVSKCHCRVKKEQAEAWTAASKATAAHAADWKQAHEVICALDSATSTTCDIPTCPTVTQPTLAAGVSSEDCTKAAAPACAPDKSKGCKRDFNKGEVTLSSGFPPGSVISLEQFCSGVYRQNWCATFCCGKYTTVARALYG